MTKDDRKYRRGVGVMLLNDRARSGSGGASIIPTRRGRCRRAGSTRARSRGRPRFANWRGNRHCAALVERIAECPERLKYDLPKELRGKLWGGKWKGQVQDWYLCRFLGTDSDVDIATKHAEFSHWKWVEPAELPDLIVPFKRDLYRRLIAEFEPWL